MIIPPTPFHLDATMSPELQQEQQDTQRKRSLASAIMQMGMGQTQMPAGARLPILDPVSKIMQALVGAKMGANADVESKGLAAKSNSQVAEAVAGYKDRIAGQAAPPRPPDLPESDVQMNQGRPPEDAQKVVGEAMVSQHPLVRHWADKKEAELAREKLAAEAAAARTADKREAMANRTQDKEDSDQRAADLRRDMQASQQRASADAATAAREGRSEAALALATNNRALAMERIAEKRQADLDKVKDKTDEGKSRVSINLGALGDYYNELDKMHAMVDPSNTNRANLSARIRASGVGQFLGAAVGTQEQTIRDNINQMRPLLINDIRQASAMGARGLDSNIELNFYLQAATDPKRSIQSNRAALKVLEDSYGNSSKVSGVSDEHIRQIRAEYTAARAKAPTEARALPPGLKAPIPTTNKVTREVDW